MSCEKGLQKLLSAITHLRKLRENGYKLWVVLVMVARWCSKQPLTNHMQCFATQRILEIIARKLVLIPLTIRGYVKEVSMATWWARTTPANHCQVASSKRTDFNGKLLSGPRTATGYVTKRSFGWLPRQLRTITLLRISLKPLPTTKLFNTWGTP